MASSIELSIVTPSAVKFAGRATIVVAPGAAGDLAALPQHAPMLTTLRAGAVAAVIDDGEAPAHGRRIEYAVDGGFMQILPEKVIVLTSRALSADEIDAHEARSDLAKAEHEEAGDDVARRAAQAWAKARLQVKRIQEP
ncbi:MAG TPA: ATP synthase F1 subunit epsilon [Candidatus Eremiobacteraceae bacterium]|nr:ATP synthase F1 subunit epsilon [Candidatus Eremiobacteraceae bacterium]